MHTLFVYGSLLEGLGNHRYLKDARLVRHARTAPAYTLVSLGGFPGLLEGGTMRVLGEVYEVDDETLAAVDRLEGHPSYYERVPVRLERRFRAEGYVLRRGGAASHPIVEGGNWRRYLCASK